MLKRYSCQAKCLLFITLSLITFISLRGNSLIKAEHSFNNIPYAQVRAPGNRVESPGPFLQWPLLGISRKAITRLPDTPWTHNLLGLYDCPPYPARLDAGYWTYEGKTRKEPGYYGNPEYVKPGTPREQLLWENHGKTGQFGNAIACYGANPKTPYPNLDHEGTDIGAKNGTAVHAAYGGVVKQVKNGPDGKVVIEHLNVNGSGQTWYTIYRHLSKTRVAFNQPISTGAIIGDVGAGHLHFETAINNFSGANNKRNPWGIDSSPWDRCLWVEYSLCPYAPALPDLPLETNVVRNGFFDAGADEWQFVNLAQSVSGGIMFLNRTALNGGSAIFQDLGYNVDAGSPLQVQLEIANTSSKPKQVNVQIRNIDNVIQVISCPFTIRANTALEKYVVQGKTVGDWRNVRLEIYLDEDNTLPSLGLDNISVRYYPTYITMPAKECFGPTDTNDWIFTDNRGQQAWTIGNHLENPMQLPEGFWHKVVGNDPYLIGPNIAVNTEDFSHVYLKMASQSSNCGTIFFRRAAPGNETFVSEQKVNFAINPDGVYRDYLIDMRTNLLWTGTIVQLRLDPACALDYDPGRDNGVAITELAIVTEKTDWSLTSTRRGWRAINHLKWVGYDSVFQTPVWNVTGGDSQVLSPRFIGIDAADQPVLKIQMASQNTTCGQIYFRKQGQLNFTAEQVVSFKPGVGGATSINLVNMGSHTLWNGTIVQLRLDPACNPGVNGTGVRLDQIVFADYGNNVLNDPSFEDGTSHNAVPAGWFGRKLTNDKPVCADSGMTGQCAFHFTGKAEDVSSIEQFFTVSGVKTGNTLTLKAWVSGKNAKAGGRIQLDVVYADQTKAKMQIPVGTGTFAYTPLEKVLTLKNKQVIKLVASARMHNGGGSYLVDDMELYLSTSGGLIPILLPNIPTDLRGNN